MVSICFGNLKPGKMEEGGRILDIGALGHWLEMDSVWGVHSTRQENNK